MSKYLARALRKRMTPQEVKLWVHLGALRSRGHHFRRQAPLGGYILDFVSFKDRVVIELDGGQHGEAENMKADAMRDAMLAREGFQALRFWNNEIDEGLDGVWRIIMDALNEARPRRLEDEAK